MQRYDTAQEIVKSIVQETISPMMKERRYRKRATTWSLEIGDIVRLLNIQSSTSNSAQTARFTVNVGVHHAEFHRSAGLYPAQGSITVPDCDVRRRIGHLMGREDTWWEVDIRHESAGVRIAVAAAIRDYALPWLDSMESLEDLYQLFITNGEGFWAAVAADLLARRDEARAHLNEARQTANPYFKRTLEYWAREHGYDS